MITEITEKEYYEWLKDSTIVEDRHFTFTSFNGYHEGSTIIMKNGKIYDLIDWFDYAKEGMISGSYIKELRMAPNQYGEGI